jgi:hypothetical protein
MVVVVVVKEVVVEGVEVLRERLTRRVLKVSSALVSRMQPLQSSE